MENEMKMMERSDTSPVRDAHSSALEASLNSDVHRRTCVFLACEASDSISGGSWGSWILSWSAFQCHPCSLQMRLRWSTQLLCLEGRRIDLAPPACGSFSSASSSACPTVQGCCGVGKAAMDPATSYQLCLTLFQHPLLRKSIDSSLLDGPQELHGFAGKSPRNSSILFPAINLLGL